MFLTFIKEHFQNLSSNDLSCFKPLDAFVLIHGKFIQDNEESQQLKTSKIH